MKENHSGLGEREELKEEENVDSDDEVASGIKSFEDVMEVVGTCGIWNVMIFILCSSSTCTSALISMSYQFLGATPDYWCHVAPLMEANWTIQQILNVAIPVSNETGKYEGCRMYDYNYTEAAHLGYNATLNQLDVLAHGSPGDTVSCSVRDFNHSQYTSTIVTEWDLVCERRVLYSTTQAVNQLGFLIASVCIPLFLDAFGRRPVALGSMVVALVLGLASCMSFSAEVFIVLRLALSTAAMSHYMGSFLLVMEFCSPSTRSSFGTMFVMMWAVGTMVVPGIAYFIRPWRYLQAALVLPYFFLLVDFWVLLESPRWLLLRERYEEAEAVLARVAAVNRRKMPPSSALRAALVRVRDQMTAEEKITEKVKRSVRLRVVRGVKQVLSPYRTPVLCRRMMMMLVLWFTVALVYYGLALIATNISADPYLYIFLGGASEVPSYLLLWLLVVHAGRRASLCGLYLLCAMCIAANAVLMFAFPQVSVAVKIGLSLLGKVGIAAAFHLLYIYTTELFPTLQRSLALGQSSFAGRVGSIISPYINDILGDATMWAPSAVFSGLALMSAGLSLLLPETRGLILPEQDHDLSNCSESNNREEDSEQPMKSLIEKQK